MPQAAASPAVRLEDYFEGEASASSDTPRREWCDGVVYAMSRGTPEHGRLTARALRALGAALPGCEVYASETMLYVEAASLSTYADLSVVGGPVETLVVKKNARSIGSAIKNPTIVVEVLSDSTERYDRGGKFQAYKQLASLEEYVLVSQDERKIEIFRRSEGFRGVIARAGDTFVLHGAPIAVDDVYGQASEVT